MPRPTPRFTAIAFIIAARLVSIVPSIIAPRPASATERPTIHVSAAFFSHNPDTAAFKADAYAELEMARTALDRMLALRGSRTVPNTLTLYNEAVTHAENAAYGAHLMESVHPDSAFRAQAEGITQTARKFLDDLSLNRDVYDALRSIDPKQSDDATKYFLAKTLNEFRRAGVDKNDATRNEISNLLEELTRTSQEFSKNIVNDSRTIQVDRVEDLAGLPEDFVKAHPAGADGKITLSIETPDYFPVIRYAANGEVRRRMMHETLNRGYPANMSTLDSLIQKRYRLARILGYPTWADYITEDKMIETANNAEDFIERLNGTTFKRAQDEYAVYVKRKQEDDSTATLVNRWEMSYYGRLIRMREFDFDPQEARAYFPFEKVKQGVLDVTSKMFGLTYKRIDNAAVWHPSVEAFEVWDGKKLLGRFFLDLHPRPGKFNHAAKFSIRQGAAGLQVPEHALVCNFPGGKPDDPGLMEHMEVKTFFHEFGHLVHAILGGQGRWEPVSGTATQRDFVEAPSQLLEEWCWDAKVLQTFARHNQTAESIPTSLVQRMRRADAFGRALTTATHAYYSAISLSIYSRPPEQVNTDQIVADLEPRFTPTPHMPDTHMQTSFGHLDGYSAVYYTYMWSLVIAKDMFSAFDRENLLAPEVAKRYREKVLAPGGSMPAKDLVRDFLKRDYNFKAFDAWLAGKD